MYVEYGKVEFEGFETLYKAIGVQRQPSATPNFDLTGYAFMSRESGTRTAHCLCNAHAYLYCTTSHYFSKKRSLLLAPVLALRRKEAFCGGPGVGVY